VSATDQVRTAVLSRIRGALGVTGREPQREAAVEDRLARHPRGTIPARAQGKQEALIELMTTMLNSQGAEVNRASTAADAVRVIAEDLSALGLPSALRMGSDPVLAALPWDGAPALQRLIGRAEPKDRAGLSRAVAAAAETGTLFLVSGADNPTTLAFLPKTHFILVYARDIVGSYEEAFDRLRAFYGEGKLPRTVNLISGPSRTADIEQTIVRCAHGPKRLHVVVLG
jgi:L-lactate dehydrogenase complex protein LldG